MDQQLQSFQISPNPDPHHHKRIILYGIGALLFLIIGGAVGFTIAMNGRLSSTTVLQQNQTSSIQPKVIQYQQELNSMQAARGETLPNKPNWKIYTEQHLDFQISYPNTWTAQGGSDNLGTSSNPFYAGAISFQDTNGDKLTLYTNFQGDDKCVRNGESGCMHDSDITTPTGLVFNKFTSAFSGQNGRTLTYFTDIQSSPATTLIFEGPLSDEKIMDQMILTFKLTDQN